MIGWGDGNWGDFPGVVDKGGRGEYNQEKGVCRGELLRERYRCGYRTKEGLFLPEGAGLAGFARGRTK